MRIAKTTIICLSTEELIKLGTTLNTLDKLMNELVVKGCEKEGFYNKVKIAYDAVCSIWDDITLEGTVELNETN